MGRRKISNQQIKNVIEYAATLGISIRAGHGLNFDKTKKIINIKFLEELNIGHFIIGESIFYGLSEVVKNEENYWLVLMILGIGIDLCKISRINSTLYKFGDRFKKGVLLIMKLISVIE